MLVFCSQGNLIYIVYRRGNKRKALWHVQQLCVCRLFLLQLLHVRIIQRVAVVVSSEADGEALVAAAAAVGVLLLLLLWVLCCCC